MARNNNRWMTWFFILLAEFASLYSTCICLSETARGSLSFNNSTIVLEHTTSELTFSQDVLCRSHTFKPLLYKLNIDRNVFSQPIIVTKNFLLVFTRPILRSLIQDRFPKRSQVIDLAKERDVRSLVFII